LLSGVPSADATSTDRSSPLAGDAIALSEIAALKANVRHLEEELDALKSTVDRLRRELGGS
jgi:hypothetical protein